MRFKNLAITAALFIAIGCGSQGNAARTPSPAAKPDEPAPAAPRPNEAAQSEGLPRLEDFVELDPTEPGLRAPISPLERGMVTSPTTLAPDPRRARYAPLEWPAATANHDGVTVLEVSAAGFTRRFVDWDPRQGEAISGFARGPALPSVAFLTLRVHADAAAARAHLLTILLAVTSPLDRAPTFGDIAFARRSGETLAYLAACRGNITFTVRVTEANLDGTPIAIAAEAAIARSPVLAAGQGPSGPAIEGIEAARGQVGMPLTLRLLGPADAPAPAAIAFDCSLDASVLRGAEGYELCGPRVGTVELIGYAISDRLTRTRFTGRIELGAE